LGESFLRLWDMENNLIDSKLKALRCVVLRENIFRYEKQFLFSIQSKLLRFSLSICAGNIYTIQVHQFSIDIESKKLNLYIIL